MSSMGMAPKGASNEGTAARWCVWRSVTCSGRTLALRLIRSRILDSQPPLTLASAALARDLTKCMLRQPMGLCQGRLDPSCRALRTASPRRVGPSGLEPAARDQRADERVEVHHELERDLDDVPFGVLDPRVPPAVGLLLRDVPVAHPERPVAVLRLPRHLVE